MASSSSLSRPDADQYLVPAPSNPVLNAIQAQWLFTDEELTRTPSQLDGMKMEAEHISRSKGVNFITQVGIMLKLPQLTLATAAVYMHRFFMRFSMVDLPSRPGMHPYPIAATSLFLATKVEENVRRMKEIVVSCCRVAQKQPNMIVDEQSKEFWKWRDTILHHEDMLLEALCFDLQLEQPYRILYDFICFFGVGEHKPLRNAAWAFVNDSMYTVLSLQFSARIIAAAALYAAARHCDIGFKDDDFGRPWWEQLDVDLEQVRRACMRMAQLYENNAMQKHSQYYPTTPITATTPASASSASSPLDESIEKTRIPRPGASSSNTTTTTPTADNTGRKRSREPDTRDDGPVRSSNNGDVASGRSPKRQRTADAEDKPHPPLPPPSPPAPPSKEATSSQDRYHVNGHLAPVPPPPPPPPPPPSQTEEGEIDLSQTPRTEKPAAQNTHPHSDPHHRSYNDRNRRDEWDRDRDRDRDRIPDRDRERERERQRERERESARKSLPERPSANESSADRESGEVVDEGEAEGEGSEEGEL